MEDCQHKTRAQLREEGNLKEEGKGGGSKGKEWEGRVEKGGRREEGGHMNLVVKLSHCLQPTSFLKVELRVRLNTALSPSKSQISFSTAHRMVS